MLIEQVESFPDTTITLTSGKKIVVRDDLEDVLNKINQRFQQIGLIATHLKDVEGS